MIDSQYASTAYYNMDETGTDQGNMFGVNFADGRIKGYGLGLAGHDKTFFVMYVRDNISNNYGVNNFRDNGDGTVTVTAAVHLVFIFISYSELNGINKYAVTKLC